jgi:hypothetical protein
VGLLGCGAIALAAIPLGLLLVRSAGPETVTEPALALMD